MKQLLTTSEAAKLLRVPATLIVKWKHAKKITPAQILNGRGRGGQVPLYDPDELRELADDYHQRKPATRPQIEDTCASQDP